MVKLLLLAGVVLATLGTVLTIPKFKINSVLQASLSTKTTHDVVVNFREKTTSVLARVGTQNFATRAEKLTSLSDQLEVLAKTSQKSVLELLNSSSQQRLSGMTFQSFWVSNQVFVRQADASLIQAMAKLDEVEEILEQLTIYIDTPIEAKLVDRVDPIEWGVVKVGADQLWKEGINGTGLVVGGIDTGVRHTHQDLSKNFIGDFGWSDPVGNAASPTDANGHGTHTMGTIVGQNGIGVAPGAKWMACRACGDRACTQLDLVACGQFMACPTHQGTKNCSYAPNIVSNSWGGSGGDNYYDAVIEVWHEAGIIPIFAIGNEGPQCSTLGSPGDRNVIGVGSTTNKDALSSFSSVGPSLSDSKLIKPDLVAPGEDIISASNLGNNNLYEKLSGSSMATPHIAGVVALMLEYNPDLKYTQIRNQLIGGTTHNLVSTGRKCGDIDSLKFPNHAYGYGRVKAWAAVYGSSSSSSLQSMAGLAIVIIAVLGKYIN